MEFEDNSPWYENIIPLIKLYFPKSITATVLYIVFYYAIQYVGIELIKYTDYNLINIIGVIGGYALSLNFTFRNDSKTLQGKGEEVKKLFDHYRKIKAAELNKE